MKKRIKDLHFKIYKNIFESKYNQYFSFLSSNKHYTLAKTLTIIIQFALKKLNLNSFFLLDSTSINIYSTNKQYPIESINHNKHNETNKRLTTTIQLSLQHKSKINFNFQIFSAQSNNNLFT